MSPWGAIHVRKWQKLVAFRLDQDQERIGDAFKKPVSGCTMIARPTYSQLVRDSEGLKAFTAQLIEWP